MRNSFVQEHKLICGRVGTIIQGVFGQNKHMPISGQAWHITHANQASLFTDPMENFKQEANKMSYLEFDVFQKVKLFSIHPEVLQDLGVVHEVGVMVWDEVITEAHHFLRGVDDHGFVNTGPSFFRVFLWQIRRIGGT